jgi:hypothetical protein
LRDLPAGGTPAQQAAIIRAREARAAAWERGRASEARVLKEMGLQKSNKMVSTSEGRAKPDALTVDQSIEIKDATRVDLSRQLRIETEAARAAGRQSVLITGENTCVSGPCTRAFDQIIRRRDLGPQE